MTIDIDVRAHLLSLSDEAWRRLSTRVRGLTGAEYHWEPASGCWGVRRAADGTYATDFQRIPPDPAPLTTLAWRLVHLLDVLQAERTATWLGVAPDPDDGAPGVPGAAVEAVRALEHAYAVWRRRLAAADDAHLAGPMGPIAGPYAQDSGAAFALHIIDELIHHGAEVATMRDLHQASRLTDPIAAACLRGDRDAVERLRAEDSEALDRTRRDVPDLVVHAAARQEWEAVALIAELGFDLTARAEESGATALHYAAGAGRLDVARMLLDRGCDPSKTETRFSATPAGWAEFFGHADVAAELNPRR